METTYFLQDANNAKNEFVLARKELLDYMGSRRLKSLKKDDKFIRLTNKVKAAKKLWYDYNAAVLISYKSERV